MATSKFSEIQVIGILKQADGGRTVAEVCRQAGISTATYFMWKSKFEGWRRLILGGTEIEKENLQ